MANDITGIDLPSNLTLVFSNEYTTTADIAATATSKEIFITEADQWSYAPFDTLVVQNLDVVDIAIILNNNTATRFIVRAGQTVSAENQVFRYFQIQNLDAATKITAGKPKLLVQKRGVRRA